MHDKQYEQKNMSPIAAGITGLILGIVGTAAVALSDKDTRKKVTKKANEMKDSLEKWSKDTLHDMSDTEGKLGQKFSNKATEFSEKVEKKADDTLKEEPRNEL